MSSATALIIESADSAQNEKDRVFLWRCEELRRAGYGLEDCDPARGKHRRRPASRD